jgi:hypothetical protein
MVRPYLDEIARNADHAREVARTLTPGEEGAARAAPRQYRLRGI